MNTQNILIEKYGNIDFKTISTSVLLDYWNELFYFVDGLINYISYENQIVKKTEE